MKDILERIMAMPFDMNELFTAHFSISTDAAETARKLKRDLGFESNYEVARLALGLSERVWKLQLL